MAQLMKDRAVIIDRGAEQLPPRHMNPVLAGGIIGKASANADIRPACLDQRLGMGDDDGRVSACIFAIEIFGQIDALVDVEDGEALEEGDVPGTAIGPDLRLAIRAFGHEGVGIADANTALALPDAAAQRHGLTIGQPLLCRIA
nr:hypothetical protein [Sphingobium phenoxybenzoativorans]